jgi:hypothetical protein
MSLPPFPDPDCKFLSATNISDPHLHDERAVDGPNEGIELFARPRELNRVRIGRDVDDLPAEYVARTLHLRAVGTRCAHLYEHKLALHVVSLGKIDHLDDLDHLVQVLDDLLDLAVVAHGGERQPRQGGIFRGRNGEAVNVIIALGEEPHHPGQRSRLVFEQHRDDAPHQM